MKFRKLLMTLVCVLMLSACGGETQEQIDDIPEQDEVETVITPVSDEVLDETLDENTDDDPFAESLDKLEYEPSVFPEWCRDDVNPWDTYTCAVLTDGTIIIVPNMKLTDLPQSFRDTLTCTKYDYVYDVDPAAQDVFYAVYQTDDLQLTTVYYDPEKSDLYEDAGVEYIREIIALSDKFCTYQGARLGGYAPYYLWKGSEGWQTNGTPYMVYGAEDDVITELRSASFSELDTLKLNEIGLLRNYKG